MKTFKQFISRRVDAVTVPHLPVHGSHAQEKKSKKKDNKKDLKEGSLYDEDRDALQKLHLPKSVDEYHEHHNMSDEEHDNLNKGYRPRKSEVENKHSHSDWGFNPKKPVTHEVRKYTGSSHDLNRNLVHHATDGGGSLLHPFSKYKKLSQKAGTFTHARGNYDAMKDRLKTSIKRMDHAFKKSKLKHDATVMTGVGFNPDHYASQHPERHIHMPAYTSSSSSAFVASKFAKSNSQDMDYKNGKNIRHGHVLRIHLPRGHAAIPILHRSAIGGEHETILPRNMKLKVSKEPYHTKEYDEGHSITKLHYWDAHPVDHKS